MNKNEIKRLIGRHKYIFIGEVHGTKKIPLKVFDLLKETVKKEKIIFCLELSREANLELHKYLKGLISRDKLFSSIHLRDVVGDNRMNDNILHMYKKLYALGCIFKGLENYKNEYSNKRDKEMASTFINIISKNKADKYIVYVGNLHVLEKPMIIKRFKINPIKIYLPKNINREILTIQFNKGNREEINFDTNTNTFNYSLTLNSV